MRRFTLAIALFALCVALLPDAAAACSVCYGGDEQSRKAFLFTTVLLSLLPIGMIGTLAWIVWRSVREGERSNDGEEASPISPPIS
jgi:di/tricarboxylate transporter